ncbi:MAG: AI-2E family transporter [Luteitalea sp.]|nr:AI-2E family transporter [Luteitalea sp.]
MSGNVRFRRGFLLALVVAISAAFVFVIQDFLMTTFLAAIFSGLAQPLYRRLRRSFGREGLASAATILIVMLLVVGPLVMVLTVVTNEAVRIADNVKPWVQQIVREPLELNAYMDRIPGIERIAPYREWLLTKASEAAGSLSAVVVASLSSTTRGTLTLIVEFFMMLYAMFFFLKDGRRYLDSILRYLPLRDSEQELMLQRFVSVTRATLKGTLLIGILQGSLSGVMFAILGISGAVFWGLLMVVLSIIPLIGGALVWIPAAIVLAIQGEWIKALVLTGVCAILIGSIDNLLRPRLVGHDTQMPDLLVLFSTLGGIAAFGAIGFIVGPIVAALFVTIWEIFGKAYRADIDVEPLARIEPR